MYIHFIFINTHLAFLRVYNEFTLMNMDAKQECIK